MSSRLPILTFILVLFAGPVFAGAKDKIAALAPSGLVYVLDEDGNELIAQNADKPFVPASVTKIVTAWLALEVLGGDHRFETSFYLDKDRVLYVRGGGDPFLVSEELALLAPKLIAATGKKPFKRMVLDASYFPAGLRIPGIENTGEAYDALNSALAVNFNTINARRRGKTVTSAEEQTPITPLAISQFKARGPKKGRSRISLAQEDPSIGVRYAGELIAAFIEQEGGKVEGKIATGKVPKGLKAIYVHRQSRPLSEILKQMMIGSNNYIANQVFLELGAHGSNSPASLDTSQKVTRKLLAKHDLAKSIHLEEGSGISRGHRFTARGLAKLLDLFAPHAALMRRTKKGSRYKTGTFSGVRTLAGFAETAKHGRVRFVISLNSGNRKLRFRLLREIEKGL